MWYIYIIKDISYVVYSYYKRYIICSILVIVLQTELCEPHSNSQHDHLF